MSTAASTRTAIKVLVVEDHSVVREGIVSVLNRQKGIEVIAEAKNGKEAITLHATHQPDITLMDLRMPQVEGLEAVIQIRTATPPPASSSSPPTTPTKTSTSAFRQAHAATCLKTPPPPNSPRPCAKFMQANASSRPMWP